MIVVPPVVIGFSCAILRAPDVSPDDYGPGYGMEGI